jgi:ubiquinone/menaquinone biosynthesis C-methylase UbiE
MKTSPVRVEYDRLAAHYDRRWQPYIEVTLSSVIEALEFQGDEEVLDVPCGTGELHRRLIAKWPDLCLTGVDLSPGMLAQAKAKDETKRTRWVEADVDELPMPDESYDCVICANSFHYFRAPSRSLEAMRRVLRPGGRLLLVDWCDDYWTCKACSLWLRWTNKAFYRTYSLKSCIALAEDAGFEIEHCRRFRVSWLWGLLLLDCRRPE